MYTRAFSSILAWAVLWCAAGDGRAQTVPPQESSSGGELIQAIGYPAGGGSVNVDFKGTGLISHRNPVLRRSRSTFRDSCSPASWEPSS
ncbi:exported hypothetical protein [Candidatus Sulfopaludibacter sp. SbA3]|nr:exported hypothetical protein [Candidatus Sulfopaludibacter sp. SbA3]